MPFEFPDRSDRLFGREADVAGLLANARHAGMTVVRARARMGKTWTAHELARRLGDAQTFVGYHEAKGSENHMLHAVSDLYARWFATTGFVDQAQSLWDRHKGDLIGKLARNATTLFAPLKLLGAPGFGDAIRVVESLGDANEDLKTAGIKLAPLKYDQALAVTSLVGRLSERPLVLMLDGWEHSATIEADRAILDGFLRNIEDWPRLHVYVFVRHPFDVDGSGKPSKALLATEQLAKDSGDVGSVELKGMDLAAPGEVERLMGALRDKVPAARRASEDELLRMIDGFPGVLKDWQSGRQADAMRDVGDLTRVAEDAQRNRYSDLGPMLSALGAETMAVAARLAYFPRMDARTWDVWRDAEGAAIDRAIDDLKDRRVLEGSSPSFGHDTRHVAVRGWFREQHPSLFAREGEASVLRLAARISGIDEASRTLFELIVGAAASIAPDAKDAIHVLAMVRTAYGDSSGMDRPEFDRWVAGPALRAGLSGLVGEALNNRGVARGKAGDVHGAIEAFSAVIALPGAPMDHVARALNNRAVAHKQGGDMVAAVDDCTAVIALRDAPADQVAIALNNRAHVNDLAGDASAAIRDYGAIVDMPGVTVRYAAIALASRGTLLSRRGDAVGAIHDFDAVVALPDAPVEQVAVAYYNRALEKSDAGDEAGAIADYGAAIALPGAPAEHVATALFNRGMARMDGGDPVGGVADYRTLVALPGAPTDQVAKALNELGLERARDDDVAAALVEFDTLIALPDVPAAQRAVALNNRSVLRARAGDVAGKLEDLDAVIALGGAPVEQVAQALINRGRAKSDADDVLGAMSDFSDVLTLADVPLDHAAAALLDRGLARSRLGDTAGELKDYGAVIDFPGMPVGDRMTAFVNRAIARARAGDLHGAIEDDSMLIAMPEASAARVTGALISRGSARARLGDVDGAIEDFGAVIARADAPPDQAATALHNRALARSRKSDVAGALDDVERGLALPDLPDGLREALLKAKGLLDAAGPASTGSGGR